MKKIAVAIGLIAVLLLLQRNNALAQQTASADACRETMINALAREQREFRSVVFGETTAEDAAIGHVRYDNEANAWRKVGDNQWQSVGEGFANTTWSNTLMDQRAEFAERRGIFDTQRTLTSELIPYLLQSYRALQCRSNAVYEVAKQSFSKSGNQAEDITVQPLGCIEFETQTYPTCHFSQTGELQGSQANSIASFPTVVRDMLNREAAVLKFAVEYDAAYRSLLQFSGNFDLFIREFRWPLTGTLRDAAAVIGQVNRIPCFLSSCLDVPPQND